MEQQLGGFGGVEMAAQHVARARHSAAGHPPATQKGWCVLWEVVQCQQCLGCRRAGWAHAGTTARQSARLAAVAHLAAVLWWWW